MLVYFLDNIDRQSTQQLDHTAQRHFRRYCIVCLFFSQKSIATDLFLHWRQLQRLLQKLAQQQLFAKIAVVVQRLALSTMMDWESDEYFDSSSCLHYYIQKLNWKLAMTNRDLTKKDSPEK